MSHSSPPHEVAVRARLKPPPNPLRMLISPLGWGAVAYCASAIVGGILALVAGILGVFVLPLVAWITADMEARRLRLLGLRREGPLPSGPIRHPWDANGLREGNLAVWGIAVLFALVDFLPGALLVTLVLGLTTQLVQGVLIGVDVYLVGFGLLVVLVAGLYVAWALATVQAILVEDLVRPRAELREQVDQLTTSRRELVDVFAAERRRIERDLHDGAQQQLVLLSMQLGEAEYALDTGRPEAVREALTAARSSMETAMTSLRETVRGIHPQILTDRGLADAVRELAERQPVPVTVAISGDRRPAEQLALAAYYLVSEAFTNAVKHAVAST
ncbi:MAG TPA: histidine kinase, partial [Micropruina sp.]|nr:histidine kinase [Micropruina sp.]